MKNFTLLLTLLYFVAPGVASAGLMDNVCSGLDCNACDLIDLVDTIVQWILRLAALLGVAVMCWAGFKLVASAGNPSALQDAKNHLYNAIIGFVIIMAAWLIVDTIIKMIATDETQELAFGMWNETDCGGLVSQAVNIVVADPIYMRDPVLEEIAYTNDLSCEYNATYNCTTARNQCTSGGGTVTGQTLSTVQCDYASAISAPVDPNSPGLTQAEAEALLAGQNIQVASSGGCTNKNVKTCTSLEGVKPLTLQRILELQESVGTGLVVTGGTETGHMVANISHGTGYKIDLRTEEPLNNYIETNFTKIGPSKYKDSNGNVYFRHGPVDHWDVTVTQ